MTRFADLLDLVRAPAALTVLGDTVVGAVHARGRAGGGAVPLSAASACLYAAGMALNDYSDAELDAVERPERPIPSGRVSRGTALGVATGLTAAGIGLAFAAGRASGLTSLALAASVWIYDLAAKPTVAGPVVMAACRGLDVLMGAAGPGWRAALAPAALVSAHTAALTIVSRGEVHGTTTATATATTTMMAATAATIPIGAANPAAGIVGAAGYAAAALPAQLDVARTPDAQRARTATRAGIRAMVPLQIALVARTGAATATAALVAIEGVARLLARAKSKGDVT